MTMPYEKRRSRRQNVEAPILCSYFNKPAASAHARAINFSRDGMVFISDTGFHPGAAVYIRFHNDGSHQKMPENIEGLRQTTLAEVRWCKQISEKPNHYAVGVKYYESWY